MTPKIQRLKLKKWLNPPKITLQKVWKAQQIALALTSENSDMLLIKELRSPT